MSSPPLRQCRSTPRLALAALVVVLGLMPACASTRDWVEQKRPWTQATIAHAKEVRVENADGTTVDVEHPQIVHDANGDFLTGHSSSRGHELVRIDLAKVQSLELSEVSAVATVESFAWGIVLVAAAVLFVLYG